MKKAFTVLKKNIFLRLNGLKIVLKKVPYLNIFSLILAQNLISLTGKSLQKFPWSVGTL